MTTLYWLAAGLVCGLIGKLGWLGLAFLLGWLAVKFSPRPFRFRRLPWSLILGILLFFALGCWRLAAYKNRLELQVYLGPLFDRSATVIAPLDRRDSYAFLPLRLNAPPFTAFRAKISRYSPAQVGDRFLVTGQVTDPNAKTTSQPEDLTNSFDYGQYLRRFGITGLLNYPKLQPVGQFDRSWLLYRWLAILRDRLEGQINRLLPEPEASFLAGLLVGARRAIPATVLDDLKRTGTTHIIAVSGANVVIVSGLVLSVLRLVTGRRGLSFWLSQIVILGYVVLTGMTAAAVRGGIVSSLSLLAKHKSRRPNWGGLLLVPATLTLAVNPLLLTDVGWQLSFAAFAGIIIVSPVLLPKLAWLKIPDLLKAPLVETVSANILVLPVSLYSFGGLSASALLANPAVLWLVPTAMTVGFGATIASTLLPAATLPLRLLAVLPLRLILTTIHYLARLPWSYVQF